jgi:hypothetical protein
MADEKTPIIVRVTLKSGAVVRLRVTEFNTTLSSSTGAMTGYDYKGQTALDGTTVHYINPGEIAAIQREEENDAD